MFNRNAGARQMDELNRALLITGLVAAVAGLFFQYGTVIRYILTGVTAAGVLLFALRMFSSNTAKRYQENLTYLRLTTGIRTFFRDLVKAKPGTARVKKARKNPTWSELRQYKYFICPQCSQRLRVPRGKGKLRVTCTRCGNVFQIKS